MPNSVYKFYDRYFYAALLVTMLSFAYWVAFSSNAYSTFHEYDDLGIFATNMWFYLHYPAYAHGLQLLVFGNHISPLQLLVLPVFYLFQSAMTLLVVQDAVLALSAFAVFLAARSLLGRPRLAFFFFLAFIINPGLYGMVIFDYHLESFIVLFYVLAFYFYMKNRAGPFLLCLILLLSTIEEAPFLGATLGISLLLFDDFYTENWEIRKKRLRMAMAAVIISVVFYVLYLGITSMLIREYSAGAYPSLPPYLELASRLPQLAGSLASANVSNAFNTAFSHYPTYVAYALAAGIFFFGIAVLFDPLTSIILISPWLVYGLFENVGFFFVFQQYFGFVLGGSVVGSLFGMLMLLEGKGFLAHAMKRRDGKNYASTGMAYILISALAVNCLLLLFYPTFVLSDNVNNLSQDFLFNVNASQKAYYSQIYSLLNYVPKNASLATEYFILPHVFNRRYIEDIGYTETEWYFKPQYVLVDFNLNVSLNAYTGENKTLAYLRANNYSLYMENGTARLYRK